MSTEECALRLIERIWLRSAQIQPHGWASDTFGPLAEIPPPEYLKAYHI